MQSARFRWGLQLRPTGLMHQCRHQHIQPSYLYGGILYKTDSFHSVSSAKFTLAHAIASIDFLSDGAVGQETSAATPSEFRDIAEEWAETQKPFVYWASCAFLKNEKTAHHLRGVSDFVFTDGGGEGSRTPVRNGVTRASTRVSGL